MHSSMVPSFISSAPLIIRPFHQATELYKQPCARKWVMGPMAPNDAREQLLELLPSISRTGNDAALTPLISDLENTAEPSALDPRLLGVWRNAHSSSNSGASVIQRSIVGNAALAPRVEQVLLDSRGSFDGKLAYLANRVDLRESLGAVLNVVARVENIEQNQFNIRFSKAWFSFQKLPNWLGGSALEAPFSIPYPVPFRLLGDKASGWLRITYLDKQVRVSRGNRGTCFVLERMSEDEALPITEDLRSALE